MNAIYVFLFRKFTWTWISKLFIEMKFCSCYDDYNDFFIVYVYSDNIIYT